MLKLWLAFAVLIALGMAESPPFQCPGVCQVFCPYGNVRDADGCDTCACREEPNKDYTVCPPQCRMYCFYGNVRDDNNCDICQCRPAPPGSPSK
ncbi:BPTI/Kunitz domain-containing protein 4-like [Liolophura sinensis]|uniref:BPTI/Kunitz domain-containing protein 4-like n=1 Tax=Liolophura sinensis TaxID=3198878 RepID=UPI003158496F